MAAVTVAKAAVAKAANAVAETLAAPLVRAKLESAERALAALDAKVDEASLAVALEKPGAVEAQRKLDVERAEAAAEVRRLRGALRLAEQRDSEAERAQQQRVRRAAVATFKEAAAERTAAAADIADGLALATKALQRFQNASRRMVLSAPADVAWPPGVNAGTLEIMIGRTAFPTGLDVLIAAEMFRIGVTDGDNLIRMLPGADAPSGARHNRPAIEPLVTTVRRVTGLLVEHFEREVDAREPKQEQEAA